MKKREIFLFISFVTLFVLFAIFQNFSFPNQQLQRLNSKEFFQTRLQKFIPTYTFNDYIGKNIEAPYGYKEEINRRIASVDDPIVFDYKKTIKSGVNSLPLYHDLRDWIDDVSNPTSNKTSALTNNHCVNNPIDPQNNCHMEYDSETQKTGSVKVRANPFNQTASISVPGEVESYMAYDGDKHSVNVQFRKDLDENAGIKFELDSFEKSGSVNIDVRW